MEHHVGPSRIDTNLVELSGGSCVGRVYKPGTQGLRTGVLRFALDAEQLIEGWSQSQIRCGLGFFRPTMRFRLYGLGYLQHHP